MSPAGGSTTFHHSGLGVSVEVPEDWSVDSTETFPLQLFAPRRDGYRSNVMFSLEHFDPPTPEGLTAFVGSVRAAQLRDYPGFAQDDEHQVDIDGSPGVLQRYHWEPGEPTPAMAQLQALIVLEPGLLLEVDGATLASLAEELLPDLEAVVLSVRLGPQAPA